MKTRKVTIPARDTNGFLIGFKEVNALWECPTCGGEMGNPQLTQHAEDGFSAKFILGKIPADI
ncbi:hypothetical protein NMK97_03195 [Bacillus amyloliquefaciens]|nr:hypothetical protein NMK97_03195 [Bacillus amyloliquefaciens]